MGLRREEQAFVGGAAENLTRIWEGQFLLLAWKMQEIPVNMEQNPDHSKVIKRCSICGEPIPEARLEAVPGVTTCVKCASKNPQRVDARNYDLSEASPINRNGFAPKD